MDKTIFINGRFLTNKITGIERYSLEVTKALSKIPGIKPVVVMPRGATPPEDMLGLNVEFCETGKKGGFFWEQVTLPRFCRRHGGAPLLNMAMGAPFRYKNNYLTVHDVAFKEKLPYLGKLWTLKQRASFRLQIYRARGIFTVSDFSAERIVKCYPRLKVKPVRVYPGAEHIYALKEKVVEGLPEEFYFSSSSVHPNKNFQYVLALARNNPDKYFVVSGKKRFDFDDYIKENNIKNCLFTGYVSEENLMWLYSHCKAFILPSLYEGFGITPLEALKAGCKKLYLSDIPVFREVYGEVAEFFDPRDYVCTAQLSSENELGTDIIEGFLKNFSWDKVAAAIAENVTSRESGKKANK